MPVLQRVELTGGVLESILILTSETSQPRAEKPVVDTEQFAVTGSPNLTETLRNSYNTRSREWVKVPLRSSPWTHLTTREEGDIVRGQPTPPPDGGGGGGGEPGDEEGRMTCSGRGGAGVRVETGDEAAEVTGEVMERGGRHTIRHFMNVC